MQSPCILFFFVLRSTFWAVSHIPGDGDKPPPAGWLGGCPSFLP